jgi:hypothetical protein
VEANVSTEAPPSQELWIDRRFRKVTTHYNSPKLPKKYSHFRFPTFPPIIAVYFRFTFIFADSATAELCKCPTFNSISIVVCAKAKRKRIFSEKFKLKLKLQLCAESEVITKNRFGDSKQRKRAYKLLLIKPLMGRNNATQNQSD